MMKCIYTVSFLLLFVLQGWGQEGCPGCMVELPDTLTLDTAYLAPAPNGRVGEYYEADIAFRLPLTTTPVANESTPPGLPISKITVNTVANMPPGLNWEANQTEFEVSVQNDGCVRVCGTPLQPGYYEVEVVLTARVLVTSSVTSFSFPIFIEQAVTETDGFTMLNNSGCGEVEVSFQNKILSGGNEGFQYFWDFGNGNISLEEDPGQQVYSEAGMYEVNYQATVDTAGFRLSRIVVNEVGCSDAFNNAPDLYIRLLDPEQNELFKSAVFENRRPPLTLDFDIKLGEGNYVLEVLDEDSGLGGADDVCGSFNFNQATTGKLTDTEANVTINVVHVVDTLRARDTVFVFAQPEPPTIDADFSNILCKGDSLQLMTNYEENIQWYQDSLPLLETDTSTLIFSKDGRYWVQYTSPDGCIAVSEVTELRFPELPTAPVFTNSNNELTLFDEEALPEQFGLQWFLDDEAIDGATQSLFCLSESGSYLLEVVDLETGCSNFYKRTIEYDPGYPNCVSPVEDPLAGLIEGLRLYPNPSPGALWLEWERHEGHDVQVRIRNSQGQLLVQENWSDLFGQVRQSLNIDHLPSGMYFVELEMEGKRRNYRLMKN